MKKSSKKAKVAILMGSDSDLATMKGAVEALEKFEVTYEMRVISAHRTPDAVGEFASRAQAQGFQVIIAGAGGAAHLPGMLAAHTSLPVIGVPVPIGPLQGQDALLSIVQMPKGVPVATMAIGNAWNAGILAAQILAAGGIEPDLRLQERLASYKKQMCEEVMAKSNKLRLGRPGE